MGSGDSWLQSRSCESCAGGSGLKGAGLGVWGSGFEQPRSARRCLRGTRASLGNRFAQKPACFQAICFVTAGERGQGGLGTILLGTWPECSDAESGLSAQN